VAEKAEKVAIGKADAERLSFVLREMSDLLEEPGPNRLTDAQVSALCEGEVGHREEMRKWTRSLGAGIGEQL
jgi:hypothetical protein